MVSIVQMARFVAKSGKSAILGEHLAAVVTQTRQEVGCLRYELYQDEQDRWVMFEIWAGPEAIDHHLEQPYIVDFIAAMEGLVDGAPEVEVFRPADEK